MVNNCIRGLKKPSFDTILGGNLSLTIRDSGLVVRISHERGEEISGKMWWWVSRGLGRRHTGVVV